MSIQFDSITAYIGLALLAFGGFMILAGFDIISVQQVTVKQGRRTWVVGFIFTAVGLVLLFPEFISSQNNDIPETTSKVISTDLPQDAPSATCGNLRLESISPATILENEMRLYKLIGSGFCSDSYITVDRRAFVGSNPNASANSLPAEVSSDGTWLTVYIEPSSSPSREGLFIYVDNPDGNSVSLYVNYQR